MQPFAKYSDEFISKFPTSAFGYKEKAAYLTDKAEKLCAFKIYSYFCSQKQKNIPDSTDCEPDYFFKRNVYAGF